MLAANMNAKLTEIFLGQDAYTQSTSTLSAQRKKKKVTCHPYNMLLSASLLFLLSVQFEFIQAEQHVLEANVVNKFIARFFVDPNTVLHLAEVRYFRHEYSPGKLTCYNSDVQPRYLARHRSYRRYLLRFSPRCIAGPTTQHYPYSTSGSAKRIISPSLSFESLLHLHRIP